MLESNRQKITKKCQKLWPFCQNCHFKFQKLRNFQKLQKFQHCLREMKFFCTGDFHRRFRIWAQNLKNFWNKPMSAILVIFGTLTKIHPITLKLYQNMESDMLKKSRNKILWNFYCWAKRIGWIFVQVHKFHKFAPTD